jgi:hypothetical protein
MEKICSCEDIQSGGRPKKKQDKRKKSVLSCLVNRIGISSNLLRVDLDMLYKLKQLTKGQAGDR